jgi:tRNA (uracil-5-)-methyltransferase
MPNMPTHYQQQLQEKFEITVQEFKDIYSGDIAVYPSPIDAYRMRAEFKAWQESDSVQYAMYRQGEYKQTYIVEKYEAGSTTIQRLMPQLLLAINGSTALKHKLFQIEFLTSTIGDSVISLIYHRPLDENWHEAAKSLAHDLKTHIIGRSRKQKIVIGADSVTERMTIAGQQYLYQQVEGSFTQPNAAICQDMLNWAYECTENIGGDLLELYCGNGNFTLPLSRRFRRVLATEVSKTSIQSALYNCQMNDIHNIQFVRMSSEELTQALNGQRPFERLKDIHLDEYQFSTIFVDPPRAGLDEQTNTLIQRFDNILYISCNPKTLRGNIEHIRETHKPIKMAIFDQFPFTPHRECGVFLQRR